MASYQEALHAIAAPAPAARSAHNDSRLKYLCLVLPVGYSVLFFLAPLVFLVILGFWTVENYQIVPTFSLANYVDISKHLFAQ